MEGATTLASVIQGLDFSVITENYLAVIAGSMTFVLSMVAIKKALGLFKRQLKA